MTIQTCPTFSAYRLQDDKGTWYRIDPNEETLAFTDKLEQVRLKARPDWRDPSTNIRFVRVLGVS